MELFSNNFNHGIPANHHQSHWSFDFTKRITLNFWLDHSNSSVYANIKLRCLSYHMRVSNISRLSEICIQTEWSSKFQNFDFPGIITFNKL